MSELSVVLIIALVVILAIVKTNMVLGYKKTQQKRGNPNEHSKEIHHDIKLHTSDENQ